MRIKPGDILYVAYKRAPKFAAKIRGVASQDGAPLVCEAVDASSGATMVTVRMADGTPFLNGEMTLAIAKRVLVPNPPPGAADR